METTLGFRMEMNQSPTKLAAISDTKGTFEIPRKISYPHIERYNFYINLKF